MGGGGMLPKLATSRSFAFAFASTTLSIVNGQSRIKVDKTLSIKKSFYLLIPSLREWC